MQIEIKVAKLIRVCNATTMIDVVRLVIVPELLLKRYCLYVHYFGENVLYIEFRYTSMLQITPFINEMVFGSKFEDLVVRKTRDENFLWKLFKFKCVIQSMTS